MSGSLPLAVPAPLPTRARVHAEYLPKFNLADHHAIHAVVCDDNEAAAKPLSSGSTHFPIDQAHIKSTVNQVK
ncbi:hypothetical protein PF005_g31092 [Phytophthora fragariae]|uniref:Uncharacterized protein n=1 Tax=Phytophthora fragariae TaxID=53985 RepID=A0A6A3V834_9STRA|nr:hypothetical protein PF005_g31092 [Phytophthora fragariae]